MDFVNTPWMWTLGGLLVLGSPALGYILMRSAFPHAADWKTWKRGVLSAAIGLAWTLALGFIAWPLLARGSISFISLGEFFSLAGMGIILLTFIIAVATRGIQNLLRYSATTGTAAFSTPSMREKSIETVPRNTLNKNASSDAQQKYNNPNLDEELHEDNPFDDDKSTMRTLESQKPVRVRSSFLPASSGNEENNSFSGAWEPSMQEGLGLLKEEAAPPSRPNKSKSPDETTGKKSSLDLQLEQLKKDIKAFNASASSGVHSRAAGNETH